MQNIIEVQGLGKKYILGQTVSTRNFREAIENKVKGLFRKNKHIDSENEFWALKDLTFSLKPGERLGIIGKNGAGKSTTLKLLSRITEPTEGRIVIRGRLSSLLEVGTGFHPELTGKENIFLNGAILGMKRQEIKNKFDEIVDFAGIEKFLDTPVKRYSSGMYVRLAFSVAAHMEPEILVVDEVLAVGDLEFQQKCLGKMSDVASEGRTVLFVSHNMAAINSLCDRVIVLDRGKMIFDGGVSEGIEAYINRNEDRARNVSIKDRTDRTGGKELRVTSMYIQNDKGEIVDNLLSGQGYSFIVEINKLIDRSFRNVNIAIAVLDLKDHRWLLFSSEFQNANIDILENTITVRSRINELPLTTGKYYCAVSLSLQNNEMYDYLSNIAYFEVIGGDFFGTGSMGLPNHCKILMKPEWSKD